MRSILVFILTVILVVCAAVYLCLNSAPLSMKAIPFIINHITRDVQMRELAIARQKFTFPLQFHAEDVHIAITTPTGSYRVIMSDVWVKGSMREKQLTLTTGSTAITGSNLDIHDSTITATATITQGRPPEVRGALVAALAAISGYQCGDVSLRVESRVGKNTTGDFLARCYDGDVRGSIALQHTPDASYTAHTEFSNINTEKMRGANPMVFSQMSGRINGVVHATGGSHGFPSVYSFISAPYGGQIKAALLKPLIDHIPVASQRAQLQALIAVGGEVPLDTARIQIKNASDEALAADIVLVSRSLNLNINLTVDINIDGGLQSLLRFPR